MTFCGFAGLGQLGSQLRWLRAVAFFLVNIFQVPFCRIVLRFKLFCSHSLSTLNEHFEVNKTLENYFSTLEKMRSEKIFFKYSLVSVQCCNFVLSYAVAS